jgi:hypothetical protein
MPTSALKVSIRAQVLHRKRSAERYREAAAQFRV